VAGDEIRRILDLDGASTLLWGNVARSRRSGVRCFLIPFECQGVAKKHIIGNELSSAAAGIGGEEWAKSKIRNPLQASPVIP